MTSSSDGNSFKHLICLTRSYLKELNDDLQSMFLFFWYWRIFKTEYPLILYAIEIVVYMNTTQKYIKTDSSEYIKRRT